MGKEEEKSQERMRVMRQGRERRGEKRRGGNGARRGLGGGGSRKGGRRDERAGIREARKGEGKWGGGISPPRSFLKVGPYGFAYR